MLLRLRNSLCLCLLLWGKLGFTRTAYYIFIIIIIIITEASELLVTVKTVIVVIILRKSVYVYLH